MTRTYSRQTNASSSLVFGKKGKKPPSTLSTFNSAPALSSVRSTNQDDSLDDFVVAKKSTTKTKKQRVKKHVTPSLFDVEEDNDTFSPPTPIFRRAGARTAATVASDKDDKFDKLFAAGPIRGTSATKSSNPSPCWGSSSKESSIEKENSSAASNAGGLLFASFSEEKKKKPPSDLPSKDKSKKKTTIRQRKLTVPKVTDRKPFSDETLNYVSKGLEAVSLVDDVFESPAKGANLAESKDNDYESPKFCPPANVGGQQATSTPNIAVVVKSRLSEDHDQETLGEVMAPPAALLLPPPAYDLIHRKGGKRWRRRTSCAAVANGLTTPSRRRTTMMIDRKRTESCSDLNSSRRKTTVCFHQNTSDVKLMKEVEEEALEASFDEEGMHRSSFHISSSLAAVEAVKSQNTRKFDEPSDIDKVLSRCTPSQILPLENLYTPQRLSSARKVGEGAFGEVFILPSSSQSSEEEEEADDENAVVKIVPVDGEALVNGQPQMKLMDMLAEIIISSELSKLSSQQEPGADIDAPGFLTVLSCNLTEGRYPDHLLDKWDDFDRQKGSENERPDEQLFGNSQKFVVLQLRNGGQDLENAALFNAAQGFAIFQQVAHALAIAERALQFEHRDLHWGNILVKECRQKTLQYRFGSDQFQVETHGMRATIIDFSLSRLTLPNDDRDEECDIFNNLSEDPDLFTSEGDYQFDVYRMMKKHTGDEWREFHPRTNVMWLHYLLDKLTTEVYYKNKKSKTHRSALVKMRQMRDAFLDTFNSAYEYVTHGDPHSEKDNST